MMQVADSLYGSEICISNYQNIKLNLSTEYCTELKMHFGTFQTKLRQPHRLAKEWKHAIYYSYKYCFNVKLCFTLPPRHKKLSEAEVAEVK